MEGQTVIQRYYYYWNDLEDYQQSIALKRLRLSHIFKLMKKNKCGMCGSHCNRTQMHHIIPISDGGALIKDNIVEVCDFCHAKEHHFMNGFLNRQLKDIMNRMLSVGGLA